MLDVVTFKWKNPGYRSAFGPEQVNTLRSMVARNYPHPHRFTCITDDPKGIDPRVRIIPLWDYYASVPSPHGGRNPSCYRRLFLWSREARDLIGERIVCVDLDMVITGDMSALWNRPEDVVLWKDQLNPTTPYNGAMQLIRAGSRPDVWETFDPKTSPARARAKGYFGSDQAHLAYVLGPNQARWDRSDGAYSWRVHIRQTPAGLAHTPYAAREACALPENARIVNFHGIDDPWSLADRVGWIREHYR